MRRIIVFFLLAVLTGANLSGCALVKLREDVQFSRDSCLLFGEVIIPAGLQKTIVVVAYSRNQDSVTIGDYARLSDAGQYELLVPQGEYEIFAFADSSADLSYQNGEWAGFYGKPTRIIAKPGGAIYGLDIKLTTRLTTAPPALKSRLLDFSGGNKKPVTSAGAIANLDDPVFSAQQGLDGFWAPLEFFKKAGCNIYFLEPYDKNKTPVLFVHGAAGSPQDWRHFINNLDRTRYQPWVFYYPSGARLITSSFLLRKKIYDIFNKYNFERLFVVAHSMGGLVSRSALIEKDTYSDTVKLFVSISTPWGGEEMAKTGVKRSPAVIPSWKDVSPDSEFIKAVFATKIPPAIRYYLFFGHKGGGSLFRQNNDNTVTLESMLDMRAQSDALKTTGFNEDHISILSSPEMMSHFKAALAATEANLEKTYVRSKGYLNVRHSFLPAGAKPPLQMALVLAPSGNDERETQLKINPLLAAQETPGVAPKKYDISLCALGFKTEPDKITLDVQAGKIADIDFVLKPQGMIANYITVATEKEESFWGFYKELPENVKIRAIVLTGNGLTRTLTPVNDMRDREVLAAFLSSKDYAYKTNFAFFDVAEGEYDLQINADGCEPYKTKVKSQPGDFVVPSPLMLIMKK